MDLSLFLAKVLGLYLVIVSLAVLWRRREILALVDNLQSQRWFFYWSGSVGLLLGLALVISHNIWEASYLGVITALSWLTLIKGLAQLLLAERLIPWWQRFMRQPTYSVLMVIILVVGLWLAWIGFGV
jgi:hypothetical protein